MFKHHKGGSERFPEKARAPEGLTIGTLTVLMLMLGWRHVSAPLVKLQKTLKESLEQPWLGSIQYSPAGGDRDESRWEPRIHQDPGSTFHIWLAPLVRAGLGSCWTHRP